MSMIDATKVKHAFLRCSHEEAMMYLTQDEHTCWEALHVMRQHIMGYFPSQFFSVCEKLTRRGIHEPDRMCEEVAKMLESSPVKDKIHELFRVFIKGENFSEKVNTLLIESELSDIIEQVMTQREHEDTLRH